MSHKDEKLTSVEELLAYIEGCDNEENDQNAIKSTKKQKKRQKKVIFT